MRGKNVGVIGYGNMGSSIADKIKNKYRVSVFDQDKEKTGGLTRVTLSESIVDLVKESDIVLIAVKPQDVTAVLHEIKDVIGERLIISIVTGITTAYIEKALGEAKVIRVVPNLPARVGQGMSFLNKGEYATDKDLSIALKLFRFLGVTFILKEEMMNAATAISGSGPGFWCYKVENLPRSAWKEYSKKFFIPEFALAAESLKFDSKLAQLLAENVVKGSFAVLKAWHIEPAELKKQVASKGGTTEAGLEVLYKGGSLVEAAQAAAKRAEALSKKE